MSWLVLLVVAIFNVVLSTRECCARNDQISMRKPTWRDLPTTATTTSWSLETNIPMTTGYQTNDSNGQERGKFRVKKRFKKFLLPLLLAYKLKFFTLIPVLLGGLVLLTGTTGLAGFFFALFAAIMGLRGGGHH